MGTNTDPYQSAEGKYHLTQADRRGAGDGRPIRSASSRSRRWCCATCRSWWKPRDGRRVRLDLSIGTLDRGRLATDRAGHAPAEAPRRRRPAPQRGRDPLRRARRADPAGALRPRRAGPRRRRRRAWRPGPCSVSAVRPAPAARRARALPRLAAHGAPGPGRRPTTACFNGAPISRDAEQARLSAPRGGCRSRRPRGRRPEEAVAAHRGPRGGRAARLAPVAARRRRPLGATAVALDHGRILLGGPEVRRRIELGYSRLSLRARGRGARGREEGGA